MFDNLTESFRNIADRVEDYGKSTVEYYKLRLFKSSMKGAISLVNLLVFGSLSLFVMLFLSIGAAFWLGTLFDQPFVGFLLIGALYGIALIFMFVIGKGIIERRILHKFSGLFYDEDDIDPKDVASNELEELENEFLENLEEEIETEEIWNEEILNDNDEVDDVWEEEVLDEEDFKRDNL